MQTLKAEGVSAMQRLEHNVALPGLARPRHDVARHDGTEAGALLRRALAAADDAALTERYATEVRRTWRTLRHGGALIELALDEGRISAGGRSLPISEIEFELLSGPPEALLALAARWVERFGLVLDVRSKSERGHRLAEGLLRSPPTTARPLRLPAKTAPAEALVALLANPLGQVLANACQVAAGTEGDAVPEDLHQLRVGLRRLRSVLRLYGQGLPAAAALAPALTVLFRQLGAARDRDAMAEWLGPALQAAGAPRVDLPAAAAPASAVDPAALLAAPATQKLWLALLAACHGAPPAAGPSPSAAPTRAWLRAPLRRLLRQVQRDAARFATLDDGARHRLRRRIKRLRYALELTASAWPDDVVSHLLRRLQRAQQPLGDYNDGVVALAAARAAVPLDARAWFAVGWLTARQAALQAPCEQALQQLARARGLRDKG